MRNKTLVLLYGLLLSLQVMAGELIVMTPVQQKALGITVAPLATATALTSNRLPGEIVVPLGQERVVSSAQPGLIEALLVAAGQSVKKGQPLALLSSPDLIALQRDYLQAETQLGLARNSYTRDAELFKDGIIAERRYLASKSQLEELTAVSGQRRQTLRLAGMSDAAIGQLQSSGVFSSRITVTAPISGQVLEQLVTSGQRVEAATPLYRIGNLTPLWLEIHAPVEALGQVAKGMSVIIPKYDAGGKIIAIIRNVNKNDQTMHVRAEITRNADRLSPGQFVEVEVAAEAQRGTQFSVPKNAVVRNGGASYVFVQTSQGFAARQLASVTEQAERAIIAGKLDGAEQVAVTGTVAIKAAWIGSGSE